jgi:hypothetical protein
MKRTTPASYIAIDGVGSSDGDTGNNNGITSMDAIQEIRVVMNSYTAEFGRNTGPQINVVTKSGGQRYSGSLSTYIRHEALIPIPSRTSVSGCQNRLRGSTPASGPSADRSKSSVLRRGHRLQFRADAYNTLGISTRTVTTAAQFDPQGRQVNSDFGRLALPTAEARQIELSLKYSF